MIRLICGDAGSGKTTRLTTLISQEVAAHKPALLIVPEQQTVSCERAMADALPSNACLFFEVTNFTRLTDTVFRLCGGLSGKACSPAVEQVLMWRTLSELQPLLRTRPMRPEPKAVAAMRGVVQELRAHRLTPAILDSTAGRLEDQALSDKVRDYALISSAYHALLTEYFSDSADRLDRAGELLTEQKPLSGYTVYLDNFSSFTEQEYAVLEALALQCELCITLCVPPMAEKQLCAGEVLETRERLTYLAATAGVPCETIQLGGNRRNASAALRYAAENLYRIDYASLPPYAGGADDALALVEAADPTDACTYIAADILRRVQCEGRRYADFTVVCADPTQYEGVLDAALEQNGIPCFFAHSADTLSLDAIKMIFCAYAVMENNWRREDVVAYLKCGLTGADKDACDELELYSETWNIHGARWYDGIDFHMNPDGLEAAHTRGRQKYSEEELSRINEARRHFVPPLEAFAQIAKKPHDVSAHIRALTDFLLAVQLPEQLDARAEAMAGSADGTAQVYAQLWDVICDALDTLSALLPDTCMTAGEFADLLKLLFSAVDMGRLPASMDEVTVGKAALLRSSSVKHVYLLGVNDGEFPGVPQDDGAFTEAERAALAAAGTPTSDALDIRASRELFAFYRALTLTSETVCVLWSRTTTTSEEVSPADAVLRLRKLLGAEYPVRYLTRDSLGELIWSAGEGQARLGQCGATALGYALREVLSDDPARVGAVEALDEPLCNRDRTLSGDTLETVYPQELALTQSRIDSFVKCPFSYFCTYTLKLNEEKRAAFSAVNIGTFLHAILEGFFSEVKARGMDMHALSDEEQKALLDEVSAAVIRRLLPPEATEDPRTQFLLDTLHANAVTVVGEMCDELRHSRFEPMFFELGIRKNIPGSPAPVTFETADGSRIYVYGTIDRVDTLQVGDDVYVRVVDYKTGTKSFEPENLKRGENLQMPLYLCSLLGTDAEEFREALGVGKSGQIRPAGVLYLSSLCAVATGDTPPTAEEARKLSREVPSRSGLFCDDPTVLAAMDDTQELRYLPLRFTKDGTPAKTSERYLCTPERFEELFRDIGNTLTDLATRMKQGDLRAIGDPDHCKHCRFKPICRTTARPVSSDGAEPESSGTAEE